MDFQGPVFHSLNTAINLLLIASDKPYNTPVKLLPECTQQLALSLWIKLPCNNCMDQANLFNP